MRRTPRLLREAALTLGVAAVVVLAVQAWMLRDATPHWREDGPLAWVLPDGSEGRGTLSDLRARLGATDTPVALYVWATWCPICDAMDDQVDALARTRPVLTVATRSGDAAAVRRHLATRGLRWVVVFDANGHLADRHGWRSVPMFSVLMPDGTLRHTTVGYTTGWGLRLRLWLAGH
ncbi:redoxin family protein [Tepidimonas sp.]|uniref:redoxin family protein n=1 Tax=Tepidimonas sp. TaxID=2002775 RepID=UPI002FE16794